MSDGLSCHVISARLDAMQDAAAMPFIDGDGFEPNPEV